jgi:hypothetical protein
MTRAAQKGEELFYVQEFLRHQFGFALARVTCAPQEPPDAWAAVTNPNGTSRLLDIEMAEYHVDDPRDGPGGSPSRRAVGCWGKLQAQVASQLQALRVPVAMTIRFRDPLPFGNSRIRRLTDELVRFGQEFCPGFDLAQTHHDEFSSVSYPLLHEHAEWIALTRFDDLFGIFPDCSNLAAANVGVVPAHLKSRIELKSGRPFVWRPGAEKWLLIYASGVTPTSRAGPRPPDPSVWNDAELVAACEASVFDHIYFWERVRNWSQELK